MKRGRPAEHRRSEAGVGSLDPSVFTPEDVRVANLRRLRSADQFMMTLLDTAAALARPAISGFKVGAVAKGTSGTLYLGANLEFPGLALGASVHAEQAAVANAWAHGETRIDALAVTAMPCGHCRQFLLELDRGQLVKIRTPDFEVEPLLGGLIVAWFGPLDLGVSVPLMQDAPHGLAFEDDAEPADALVAAALAAADTSHAPYSGAYAGVALATEDGRIETGRYAENAAFNPSLPPLQGALARLALTSTPFDAVVRAVLVERPTAVSQRAATEELLRAVSPRAALEYRQAVTTATVQASEGLDSTDTSALS